MSTTIEEETGTYIGPIRRHNGYSAGSFTTPSDITVLDRWFAWGRSQSVPPLRSAGSASGPPRTD